MTQGVSDDAANISDLLSLKTGPTGKIYTANSQIFRYGVNLSSLDIHRHIMNREK